MTQSNIVAAAKEHSNKLSNDKVRLSEKLKTISDDVIKFRAEKEEANAALEQCEKQFIRDEVTISDLGAAQATFKDSSEKHAAAERLHQLVIDELQKLERDILEAQKNINTCSKRLCAAEKEAISLTLNQDVKIRSKLLEAYSAKMLANELPTWSGFLVSIFSEPSKNELDEAMSKFRQKHNIGK
ncbi:MAG: hypothetical protein DYH15_14050 [Nitrosomonas sp. PRO4]|nr:hypothetical protein [Nitrosomonas sp. PRO4]